MEKKKKPLFYLLLLFLLISDILPLFAGPLSRSFALESRESAVQLDQDQVENRELQKMWEHFRRMDIEVNDYPGSGANNRHDPKSPGNG